MVEVSSEKGPKYIYTQEHKFSWLLLSSLWKVLRKKLNKRITKQSEEYFFHQRCKKTTPNTVMASRIWLADYVVRLFDSHLFISLFQRNKIHFSATNWPFWPAKCATIPDKLMMIDVLFILRRNEKRSGDLEEISRSTALHFCWRQNGQTVAFTEGYDIGEPDIELEKAEVGSIWLLKRWDTST